MNDVFISYAHIDNEPLTAGAEGWVAQFHHVLETRVAQMRGVKASIWRDPKLSGADFFSDVIMAQLGNSRIMVAVLSPRYIQSEWCVREVGEFQNVADAHGGVRLGTKSRILKVVKTPVEQEYPRTLKPIFGQQLGFEFYRLEPATNRAREFGADFGKDAWIEFVQKVDDVAHDVCELLKALDSSTPGGTTPATGKTVYLASTTSDLQPDRERLCRELIERGHSVLPDQVLPTIAGELEQTVTAQLKGAQISVHLIGSRYGIVPEDSEVSEIELQNQLAASHAAAESSFKRFLWMPEGLNIKEPRQQAFVDRLFKDAEAQRGAELVQGTIERLKSLMLDQLSHPPQVPLPPGPDSTNIRRVYMVCERADEGPLLDSIEDYLFRKGLEISRTQFEGTEQEVAAAHRQNLQSCDGVLIIFGAASRGWVDIKVSDLLQAPGYGRTRPFLGRVIAIIPPDVQKKHCLTRAADVLRLDDSVALQVLDPFALAVLSGQKTG